MRTLRISPLLPAIYIVGILIHAICIFFAFKWYGFTVKSGSFAATLGSIAAIYVRELYEKFGYALEITPQYLVEKFYGEETSEKIPLKDISEVVYYLHPILASSTTIEGVRIIYPISQETIEAYGGEEEVPPFPAYPLNVRTFLEALLTVRPDCPVDKKLYKYLPEKYRLEHNITLRWWRFITLKNILFGIIYLFLAILAFAFLFAYAIEPFMKK